MEIIDYHGDCEVLKSVFRQVCDCVSSEDKEKIEKVCFRVEFCTEPNMPDDPDKFHAGFHDGGILVAVDGMLALCSAKQRGIFAHELGHARDRFDNPITA